MYIPEDIIALLNPAKSNNSISLNEVNNLKKVLKNIFLNNVDGFFMKRIYSNNSKCKDLINSIKSFLQEEDFKRIGTLQYISDLCKSNNISFLVFKSIAPYYYLQDDIDIYIPDASQFRKSLKVLNTVEYSSDEIFLLAIHVDKANLTQLDIHNRITWNKVGRSGDGPVLFNSEILWKRRMSIIYHKIKLNIPSPEDEILILLAHAIFQHHYFTLNEIIFIGELVRNNIIDYEYLKNTSSEYKWLSLMNWSLDLIKMFYEEYWNITLNIPNNNLCNNEKLKSVVHLPISKLIETSYIYKQPNNLLGLINQLTYLFIAFYRIIIYFILKHELPFNLVPNKVNKILDY